MLHETETRQTSQGDLYEQRAWEISKELNKQLLTLAIGLVAALYFAIINKESNLLLAGKILALVSIFFLGLSIAGTIFAMQYDMKRHQILADIEREGNLNELKLLEKKLKRFTKRNKTAGFISRFYFLTAVLIGISLLIVAIVN